MAEVTTTRNTSKKRSDRDKFEHNSIRFPWHCLQPFGVVLYVYFSSPLRTCNCQALFGISDIYNLCLSLDIKRQQIDTKL